MYTVSWVSQQLGLAPGTLRAWEQRYGVVRPTRSEGGYRLYDDADLRTLKAMAGLVASGMQPAQAAATVRASGTQSRLAPGVPAGLPDPTALVDAARSYDSRALESALDVVFAAASFEYVVDEWLVSAMNPVGEGWSDGSLDVAQEHFISAAVMRRIAAIFAASSSAGNGAEVVIGLAPGATHEIATLAFATMLRRAGLRVTYLGADLPTPSWLQAVRTIRPAAVIIGAPRTTDADAAAEVISALAEVADHTEIVVGGLGTDPAHGLPGNTLAEMADLLAAKLAGSRRPASPVSR